MKRYITTDTWRGGEIIQERRTNPLLDGIRKAPSRYAATRRKSQANPRKELLWWGTLLAVVAGCWLGTRVNIAFNW